METTKKNVFRKILLSVCFMLMATAMAILGVSYMPKTVKAAGTAGQYTEFKMQDGAGIRLQNISEEGNGDQLRFKADIPINFYKEYSGKVKASAYKEGGDTWYTAIMPKSYVDTIKAYYGDSVNINDDRLYAYSEQEFIDKANANNALTYTYQKDGQTLTNKGPIFVMWDTESSPEAITRYNTFCTSGGGVGRIKARPIVLESWVIALSNTGRYGWYDDIAESELSHYEIWGTLGNIYDDHLADKYVAQAYVRATDNNGNIQTVYAKPADDGYRSPLDVSIRTVDNKSYDNNTTTLTFKDADGKSKTGTINEYLNTWVDKFNNSTYTDKDGNVLEPQKSFSYTINNYYVPQLSNGSTTPILLETTLGYANANQPITALREYTDVKNQATSGYETHITSTTDIANLNVEKNKADSGYENSIVADYIYTTNDDDWAIKDQTKFVEAVGTKITKMYAGDGELVINRYYKQKEFHNVTDKLIYGDPSKGVYAERAVRNKNNSSVTKPRDIDLGTAYTNVQKSYVWKSTDRSTKTEATVTKSGNKYIMTHANFAKSAQLDGYDANGTAITTTKTLNWQPYSKAGVTSKNFAVPQSEATGDSYNVEVIAEKDVIHGSIMDVTFAIETRQDLDDWDYYAYRDEAIWDGYFVLANDIIYSIARLNYFSNGTDEDKKKEADDLYYKSHDSYWAIQQILGLDDSESRGHDSANYGFKGTFDGRAYNIDNIRFEGVSCGFIALLHTDGIIKDLSFTNASVFGSGSIVSNVVGGTVDSVYVHFADLRHTGDPNPTAVIGGQTIESTARISRLVIEGGNAQTNADYNDDVSIFGYPKSTDVYSEAFYVGPSIETFRKVDGETGSAAFTESEKQGYEVGIYKDKNEFIRHSNTNLNFVGWSSDFWTVLDDNTPYPRQLEKKLINDNDNPIAISTSSLYYENGESTDLQWRFEIPTVTNGETEVWRVGTHTKILNTEDIGSRLSTKKINYKNTDTGIVNKDTTTDDISTFAYYDTTKGTDINNQNGWEGMDSHVIDFNRDNSYLTFLDGIFYRNNVQKLVARTYTEFHNYRVPTADIHVGMAVVADLAISKSSDLDKMGEVTDRLEKGTQREWHVHGHEDEKYNGDLAFGGRVVLANDIEYVNALYADDENRKHQFIPYYNWSTRKENGNDVDLYGDTEVGFRGEFDGRGYNIDKLQIGAESDEVTSTIMGGYQRKGDIFGSLFTVLHEDGLVHNVSFTNAKLRDQTGFLTNATRGTMRDIYIHATYMARGSDANPVGFISSKHGYDVSTNQRIVVYLDEVGIGNPIAGRDFGGTTGSTRTGSTILGNFGQSQDHRTLDGVLAIGNSWGNTGGTEVDTIGWTYKAGNNKDGNKANAYNKDLSDGYLLTAKENGQYLASSVTSQSTLDYNDANGNGFPDLGGKQNFDTGYLSEGELGQGKLTNGEFIYVDQRYYPSYIFRTTYNLQRQGWSFNYASRKVDFNANDPRNVAYDQSIMGISSSELHLSGDGAALMNATEWLTDSEKPNRYYTTSTSLMIDSSSYGANEAYPAPENMVRAYADTWYGTHIKIAPELFTNVKDFEFTVTFGVAMYDTGAEDGTDGENGSRNYPALLYHTNYMDINDKEGYSSASVFMHRRGGENAHSTYYYDGTRHFDDVYITNTDAPTPTDNGRWTDDGKYFQIGYHKTHVMKVVVKDNIAYYYVGFEGETLQLEKVINLSLTTAKKYSGGFAIALNDFWINLHKIDIVVHSYDTSDSKDAVMKDDDYVTPTSTATTGKAAGLYVPDTKLVAAPTIVQEVDSSSDLTMMARGADRKIAQNTILYVDKDMYLTKGKIDSVNNTSSRITKEKGEIHAYPSEEGMNYKLHYAIKWLKGRTLPVVYIPGFPQADSNHNYLGSDLTIARNFVQYYKECINLTDMTVMSDSYEVLQYIYGEIPQVRRALDWVGQGEATGDEDLDMYNWTYYSTICNAQIVVLDKKQANEVTIRGLQARFKTVWVDIQDDETVLQNAINQALANPDGNPYNSDTPTVKELQELYVSKAIANGAMGIMTTDCKTAFGVFDNRTNSNNLYNQIDADYVLSRTPFIIGHRGAPDSGYIENSTQGASYAYNVATHVEIDVQMSKDRKLYLFHDGDLSGKTTGSGSVKSKTSTELNALTYGYIDDKESSKVDWTKNGINYKGSSNKIGTFEALFDIFDTTHQAANNQNGKWRSMKDTVLVLELKATDYDMLFELKRYIDAQEANNRYIKHRMVFIAFNDGMVQLARGLFPEVPIAYLNALDGNYPITGVKWLTERGAVHDAKINHVYTVEESIYRGMPLLQWTYTTATSAIDGIKKGITGITNDDPQALSVLVRSLDYAGDGNLFSAHTYDKGATYAQVRGTAMQHAGIPKYDANYNGYIFFPDNVQYVVFNTNITNSSHTLDGVNGSTTFKYAVLV